MSTTTDRPDTVTVVPDDAERAADRALKARHATMWALGDYPSVASTVIPDLGATLVRALGVSAGERVLDVAAGSGNAAVPAALAGADVVAADLTPHLLDVGRERAKGLADDVRARLAWRVADAEDLPDADAAFDVVLSCVGVMFAPHHRRAADELVRVCRPGGRIGLVAWTPEGFIGQMFATMRPYLAPPPAGVQPPPLWGREDHVRELLGSRVTGLTVERRTQRVDAFTTGAQFRDFFKACYGPTVAAYAAMADRPDDVAALDESLAALGDSALADGVMEWEYLLAIAERA